MKLSVFFFNDRGTTQIYTLSLHDALPISAPAARGRPPSTACSPSGATGRPWTPWCGGSSSDAWTIWEADRKSTRLNSSHANISYAVFCLKKKQTPVYEQH